jgi:hypothetical protein
VTAELQRWLRSGEETVAQFALVLRQHVLISLVQRRSSVHC